MRVPPFRTEGGAPTTKPIPTPTRRSTRPGCECVPTPFAPRAVLLQQSQSQLRPVGAPASGANACPPLSHRGRCSYNKNQSHLRTVGAPAPGANACLPRPGCEGGCARCKEDLAVAFGVVGLPAPGVGAHGFEAEFGAPAEFFGGEGGVGVAAGDVAGATVGEDVGKFVAAGFL